MKVTVAVRTFNRPDLFKEALASIQLQSHTDWEVIIFDDGATDINFNIYKKFKETNKKERRTEEATGGRIGFNKGKRVLDLIAEANKKLKGKKSMESVNPQTGEVTVPKEPIKTAEESTGMTTMDFEPEIVDEKSILKTKKKTTQKYNQDIIKAADEIFPNYDDPKIAADQIVDSYAQMKLGLEDSSSLSNKEQMDLYRQAYDYVMDYNRGAIIKTADEFNISNPKTAEAFTNFARENDPEGFKKIQKIVDDINNKNALEEFDPTGRKPNAKGGPAGGLDYLMGF
jgi:glycosyltransferase involved in cell wall biosynthesis